MWKYILGPLLPAVIGWPWQLGHNEEHSFEENLTGVDPGGDTEPPSNNTHQKGDFWWFEGTIWGFWWSADGFGEDAPWFGTPESPGRLRSDGGWAGYFVDGIGVQAFGSWWPWVAYFVMITFLTGIPRDLDVQPAHLDGTLQGFRKRGARPLRPMLLQEAR